MSAIGYVGIERAAALIGRSPSTPRWWERAGLAPPAMKIAGRRVYTAEDIEALKARLDRRVVSLETEEDRPIVE